jgi:hypothetical protein
LAFCQKEEEGMVFGSSAVPLFLLPSSSFFFLLLLLPSFFRPGLSLSMPFLYFFFFFLSFWFNCRPSRDVIRYLFEIFIAFALWRVMHSSFFSFSFFKFYLSDISLGFIFIFLLYYSNTSA